MPPASQTTIQCVNCRQPLRAAVFSIVDPQQEPQAKNLLLAGRLNTFQCPNCGQPNSVMTPVLYHDASKELLIAYVPMELGMSKDAQEKAIGDLMRQVTNGLPQGAFKAYLLQPRHALTMQGLVDQVLQADGVTPEMIQAQRDRVRMVEQLVQAAEEDLPALVQQYDAQIDAQFLQTMTLIIQQFIAEGRQPLAEQAIAVQNRIVELSTFGQKLVEQSRAQEEAIAAVAEEINALGQNAARSDFLKLAVKYAGDEDRLQALVGLVRPVFDYQFFQEMTAHIGQSPAAERDKLEELRDDLLQLAAMVDQQAQMALQESAGLLQIILTSSNPDEVIQANLPLIDSTFLQVLMANIQEAQRRSDLNASTRLKDIYTRVITALQANMPPELRFINELLGAPSNDAAGQMIAQHAAQFGAPLLDALDAVEQQLAGQNNPALMDRFAFVRQAAVAALQ